MINVIVINKTILTLKKILICSCPLGNKIGGRHFGCQQSGIQKAIKNPDFQSFILRYYYTNKKYKYEQLHEKWR